MSCTGECAITGISTGSERERLLSARSAALRIAELFEEFSVHATWAAVGFLFARSRDDLERFSPHAGRNIDDPRLDPYRRANRRRRIGRSVPFCAGTDRCALRFGPVRKSHTHSFSHFYCCESGQGPAEFEADLRSAIEIASQSGIGFVLMFFREIR